MTYESLFVDPRGRTSRATFALALAPLLVAAAFYYFLIPGRTTAWYLCVLIVPAAVLHARRLHDLGRTAWLLVLPVSLLLATAGLHLFAAGSGLVAPVTLAALAVCAAFVLWGAAGRGQSAPNRFGDPAAA